jgi:branched-chain amino acid transport system substrate-binding protein
MRTLLPTARRTRWVTVLVAAVAALAAAAAAGAAPAHRSAPSAKAAQRCNASIGVMAPITGQVAAIGEQMLNWAKLAFEVFNRQHGTAYRLIQGDNQLDPAQATTVAQQFISNRTIVGVVLGTSSTEVIAIGRRLKEASLVGVAAAATRGDLTQGRKYPTFFRVVPSDAIQGPTIANFMVNRLKANRVFILDNQNAAGVALADTVQQVLRRRGVGVDRESTPATTKDFSSIISRMSRDADVAFIPLVSAVDAQNFVNQMREQGRRVIPFGSDAQNSSQEFRPEGGYVTSFAPDVTQIKANAALVRLYRKRFGKITTGFGPPMYASAWVVLNAVNRACQSRAGVTRAAVVAAVRRTRLKTSILGGPIAFTANGDVKGSRYFIFKTHANGRYELVSR